MQHHLGGFMGEEELSHLQGQAGALGVLQPLLAFQPDVADGRGGTKDLLEPISAGPVDTCLEFQQGLTWFTIVLAKYCFPLNVG